MKKTCLVGIITAIVLMAGSVMVTAEITPVVNGNFEADAFTGIKQKEYTGWTAWGSDYTTHLIEEFLADVTPEDVGPGASDHAWMCLASEAYGTKLGGLYQDLGTTEVGGFYVAQAFIGAHYRYDVTSYIKFSLRDTSDNELDSVQNAEIAWVVPNALQQVWFSPTLLAEVTWTADSALGLRVQMESLPRYDVGGSRLSTDDYYVVNELHGAHAPIPDRWSLDVAPSTSLQWTAGDMAGTGYEVFIGTRPDVLVSQGTTTNTSFPAALEYSTIYYWRVDTLGTSSGTITGTIWAFRTEMSLPQIDPQLIDTASFLGDDATFTFGATDPLGGTLTYQWYYDPNTATPGNEIELVDGADYSGTDTNTLTLLGVEESDHGKMFFCTVGNLVGSVNTNLATVNFYGVVYHWPFEDTNWAAGEVKGNATFTRTYGDPDVEPGVVGNALSLDGTEDGLAYLNVCPYYHASTLEPIIERGGQNTISMWVKSHDVAKAAATYISRSGANTMMLQQYYIPGMIRFDNLMGDALGDTNQYIVDLNPSFVNDQWYFLVLRNTLNETALFINGVPHIKMARDVELLTFYLPSARNVYIGKYKTGTTGDFYGAIDELKIYNYPLSDAEIAQEYANITNTSVCVPENPADIVKDASCAVDLADFSALAAQWLVDLTVYPNP